MQATSQDPDTARLMGINVDRIIMVAFALGAALAAVAGLAYGLRYTNIDFRMGFLAGLKAFTAAVLGGIGNIDGAVVGGLVLGVVEVMATILHPRPVRRLGLEGRVGLRASDPGAGLQTARSARSKGGGPRMRIPRPGHSGAAGADHGIGRDPGARRWRGRHRGPLAALGVRPERARRHDGARLPLPAAVPVDGAGRRRRRAAGRLAPLPEARSARGASAGCAEPRLPPPEP